MRCWPSGKNLTVPRGKGPVSSILRAFCAGHPHKETADGVAAAQAIHEPTDLISVPDIASLEFGEGH